MSLQRLLFLNSTLLFNDDMVRNNPPGRVSSACSLFLSLVFPRHLNPYCGYSLILLECCDDMETERWAALFFIDFVDCERAIPGGSDRLGWTTLDERFITQCFCSSTLFAIKSNSLAVAESALHSTISSSRSTCSLCIFT